MTLNWVDYIIVGVVVVSMLTSVVRGFVRELLSLVIWGLAVWSSLHFSGVISPLFASKISSPSIRLGVSVACIFVTILIIGVFIGRMMSIIINKTGLSSTDRLLGIVFGAARGMLIVAVLLVLVRLTTLTQQEWWKQSVLIVQFSPLESWLQDIMVKHVNLRLLQPENNQLTKPLHIEPSE